MTDYGLLAAIVGLGAVVSFASTTKLGLGGPIARLAYWLQIPTAIYLLWRIAQDFGWWTLAIFFGVSLVGGIANGILVRSTGSRAALLGIQPIAALLYLAATATSILL